MPSAMKKKSAKRYYKKRNNSKMSSQDFSRKLMKALNKAMTRKKMMFGGTAVDSVLEVKINNKKIESVDYSKTVMPTGKQEGFSGFSQIYNQGGQATAYMPITYDDGKTTSGTPGNTGEQKTLPSIDFESTVFEETQ